MSTVSPLLRGQGLPEFRAISPELVSTDIPVLLKQLDQDFSALEQDLDSALTGPSKLSWDAVMQPLQAIGRAGGGKQSTCQLAMNCRAKALVEAS